MTWNPSLLTGSTACALIMVTMACNRSASAPLPTPTGSTGIVSLAIHGPDRLAPGERARFTAIATMSDRSTEDYTQKVSWSSTPQSVVAISRTTGEATAGTSGDAAVSASGGGLCCNPVRMAVLVVPANTHRLTGKVQESGLPLQGATVTAESEVGNALSATTDHEGMYRLYGVTGVLQVKVSKAGYVTLVKDFIVSTNEVLDFPEVRQTQALPSVSGTYTLTVEADAGCPTASADPRTPHLPAGMQRARSYAVQITQDGAALRVAGSGPGFLPSSDRFDGRITPGGVEFQLGDGYFGYGPEKSFASYFAPTQGLSYEGQIYATRVGSTIAGRLDGEILWFEMAPFYKGLGQCRAGNHRFTMSAAPAGTMR